MNIIDTNIILNLRSGDHRIRSQSIDLVYKTYYPVIRSYIIDNSGSEVEAEDVFQDTMIVLYSNVRKESFSLTCTLKTYIYSIARNLWLNKLKSKGRYEMKEITDDIINIDTEETEVLDISPKQKRIMKEFDKIGESCKEVLYNFYYRHMSMLAIAEDMGLANEQVAKNKKSRCLKKLKLFVLDKSIKS